MNSGERPLDLGSLLRVAFDWALRLTVEIALALQLVATAFFWWLSPQGFPIDHSRFWINSILPIATSVVAVVGLTGMLRRTRPLAGAAVLCLSTAWLAGAVAGRVFFPVSLAWFWILGLFVGLAGLGCFAALMWNERKRSFRWAMLAILSALVGVGVVRSQVPPAASTGPIDELPVELAPTNQQPSVSPVAIGVGGKFYPAMAELILIRKGVTIVCTPLLDFDRISRDGFWSIFARGHTPRARRLLSEGETAASQQVFRYSGGATITMPVEPSPESVEMTCYSPVERDTFSHLNSYSVIEIGGAEQLYLSFSPCPDERIEIVPADYPVGRPARFAYLDRNKVFHVVEASSGEKGPFHTLASGPLQRGEPLTIYLYDNESEVASLTFYDWSQQLSTELSPSAGWGVPMNAIEFQQNSDSPRPTATIWITLAATGVGRGWDCVGHKAGIYRNRLAIRMDVSDNMEVSEPSRENP